MGVGGQHAAKPGPGVVSRSAQSLTEVTPDHQVSGEAETTPSCRNRFDHMQAAATFGLTGDRPHFGLAETAAVADNEPSSSGPQTVADEYPASFRAVHHGICEQFAHCQDSVRRVGGAAMPGDRGENPVAYLPDVARMGIENPPSGSPPPADDHWCLLAFSVCRLAVADASATSQG